MARALCRKCYGTLVRNVSGKLVCPDAQCVAFDRTAPRDAQEAARQAQEQIEAYRRRPSHLHEIAAQCGPDALDKASVATADVTCERCRANPAFARAKRRERSNAFFGGLWEWVRVGIFLAVIALVYHCAFPNGHDCRPGEPIYDPINPGRTC